MREIQRFDPLGWFLWACYTVLAGAIALAVAVYLIAAIWIWLALIAGVVLFASVLVSLLIWWHRRQSW